MYREEAGVSGLAPRNKEMNYRRRRLVAYFQCTWRESVEDALGQCGTHNHLVMPLGIVPQAGHTANLNLLPPACTGALFCNQIDVFGFSK